LEGNFCTYSVQKTSDDASKNGWRIGRVMKRGWV
jgi:hypothetical protein